MALKVDNTEITYGQLLENALGFAVFLRENGISSGDKITIALDNSI